jgi:hypothetical protein
MPKYNPWVQPKWEDWEEFFASLTPAEREEVNEMCRRYLQSKSNEASNENDRSITRNHRSYRRL